MRARLRMTSLGAFALLSAGPIVALGVALSLYLAAQIRDAALSDGRHTAELTAQIGIQPYLTRDNLHAGLTRAELARVDRLLRDQRSGDRVVRVKVWTPDGRVIYSDDPRIVGRRFPISDDLEQALAGHESSEVSSLGQAEDADDRRFRRLLEVYVPLRFAGERRPAGAFEVYLPYAPIAHRIATTTRNLALLLLAGLTLLWGVLLRIALRTSRRLMRQADENRHQATHDALTGLPNRTLFHDRVSRALLAARRDGSRTAVVLLDLDGFKDINDTLGHRIGDLLLQQVGPRLRAALRETDTVARLGGDEFAILLGGVPGPDAALAIGHKLLRALAVTLTLGDVPVHVDASIGVALYPDHGIDADALLQCADVAMYDAKEHRRGCSLYRPEDDLHSVERLSLVGELRSALDLGQLRLVYQPKVDLATRTIEGAEALLRWEHPDRGIVPPGEFVPLAERTALMPEITAWVVDAALDQALAWRDAGLELGVSVNVSAASLTGDALAEHVEAALRARSLPAELLTLEVTESAVMTDPMRARALLCRLADTGVRIAVDDFGAGHSSLAYLKRLPVDELKIDRAFSRELDQGGEAFIVAAAIGLGRNLGLRVVAEGVETQDGLRRLRGLGCDLVQGYAVSRPLPAAKLERWLATAGTVYAVRREGAAQPA